jgi:CheY-like chemotaxis protein
MNKEIQILLIDDDEDDRDFFQFALQSIDNNIQLTDVASGQEGLDYLIHNALPDCIFLDLNMPGMTGRECLSKLKSDQKYNHIPVVIFSTSSDPKDVQETREMGALNFITKPSKTSDLISALNNFLSNHFALKIQ